VSSILCPLSLSLPLLLPISSVICSRYIFILSLFANHFPVHTQRHQVRAKMNPYGHPQPQPPPPKREFARIARAGLKRFGPLLLTGLAAVAEHHWLKRDSDSNDDPPEPPQRSPEQPDNSINEIRDEVKKLRKKLKLKKKRKYKDGSSSSSDTSSEVTIKGPYRESARDFNIESKSPTRDHRRLSSETQEGMREFNAETPIRGHRGPLGEEQPREWPQREEAYFHGFETWGPPPPPVPDRHASARHHHRPQHEKRRKILR